MTDHHCHDQDHDHEEDAAGVAKALHDGPPAAADAVADQGHGAIPDDRPERGEHPRSREGGVGAEYAHEPTEEDDLASVAVEDQSADFDLGVPYSEVAAVAMQQPIAAFVADPEPDVCRRGSRPPRPPRR